MRPGSVLPGVLLLAAALAGVPAARACGYHDPSSIKVGMLNWSYPDALHVRTAVWTAQRDGALLRADPQAESAAPVAAAGAMQRLHETTMKLAWLRGRLEDAAAQEGSLPSFSMVFIGSMFWARFEAAGRRLEMMPHADGPGSEDVVIVTDEPVVDALLDGRMTPGQARKLGLLRLYGAPAKVEPVVALFDHLTRGRIASAADIGDGSGSARP